MSIKKTILQNAITIHIAFLNLSSHRGGYTALSSKYNTHTTHNTLMAEVCGRIGHRGLSLRRAARSYYYVSNRRASNNIQHNLWIDIRKPIGFLCFKKEKYGLNVTSYYVECAHPLFIPPLLLLGFESANPLIYLYPLLFDTQE